MKIYQTTGNSRLTETQVTTKESDLIKIKVTHLLVCPSDVNLFSGQCKLPTPFTIGKIAIGVVSDDRPEYDLRRGMKVILDPYVEKKTERKDAEAPVKTRGVDIEGFFSEYVFLPIDKIIPFPEGVEEKEAIFTVNVATALRVLNAFEGEKGDHIAILGSDATCCILAQLAIYFQYIPIMIDNNDKRLKIAREKGVYYTVDSTKEVPFDRVKEITGGRMVDLGIINLNSESSCAFLFPITKEGGSCVILSDGKTSKTVDADISLIGKKHLHVEGVTEGNTEMQSAVNMLVQDTLNLDGFIDKEISIKDAEVCLREMVENPEHYYGLVVKL